MKIQVLRFYFHFPFLYWFCVRLLPLTSHMMCVALGTSTSCGGDPGKTLANIINTWFFPCFLSSCPISSAPLVPLPSSHSLSFFHFLSFFFGPFVSSGSLCASEKICRSCRLHFHSHAMDRPAVPTPISVPVPVVRVNINTWSKDVKGGLAKGNLVRKLPSYGRMSRGCLSSCSCLIISTTHHQGVGKSDSSGTRAFTGGNTLGRETCFCWVKWLPWSPKSLFPGLEASIWESCRQKCTGR